MSAKDELQQLIQEMNESEAKEILEFFRWVHQPTEDLSDEEWQRVRTGESEIERGEYTTLKELEKELGTSSPPTALR